MDSANPAVALAAPQTAAQRNWVREARSTPQLKILLIQRNNIGDLVLMTPFLATLRSLFPKAMIHALVNTYNAPVLHQNPDVDEVFAYAKAKHRAPGQSRLGVYWSTLRLYFKLRANGYHLAVIMSGHFAESGLRLARFGNAPHVAGFVPPHAAIAGIDLAVDQARCHGPHAVDRTAALLGAIVPAEMGLEIPSPLPACVVYPDLALAGAWRAKLDAAGFTGTSCVIGVHISARRPDQRWSSERFIAVIHEIRQRVPGVVFMLFWSPGSSDNPQHPGDDDKAARIIAGTKDARLLPCATDSLDQLIAALSVPDLLFCSDGGAMHIAAAMAKPIVCLFGGHSKPSVWHPWGRRPYIVLNPPSLDLSDVSVDAAATAVVSLIDPALVS